MPKEGKNIAENINTPPGTATHVGEKKIENVKLTYTKYNKENIERKSIENIDEFIHDKEPNKVKWLNITGLQDTELIENLCQTLNVHPLVVEDILNTGQAAKYEAFEHYLFLNAKSIIFNKKDELEAEQISFLLFKDRLISFQESESTIFDPLKKRLVGGTYIRKNNADDLLYGLLDNIVDHYFVVMEKIGDEIDKVEDELLSVPTKEVLHKIYALKRELIFIQNTLWPMRNVVNTLSRNETDLIDEKTTRYFQDVYDHVIQMIDLTETYRDISSGMLDTYLSSISNKTNDVMKVLTIYSTIFIPLSFLAGVYGMNFKYFPELNWKYSYPLFWLVSILITIIMIRFFKKKDWL